MKKVVLILAFSLFMPSRADAFLLPPFKLDAGNTVQEVFTYCKTTANNVSKTVQESSIVQTTITYGKGAKEAFDFAKKMMNEFKDFNLNKMGSMLDDMTKLEAEKSKTAEAAAKEIGAKKGEVDKKLAAIDENQIELRKKIMEDPKNAKKYQKSIEKNDKQKAKLIKDLDKEIKSINRSTEKKMGKLSDAIKNLQIDVNGLISDIVSVPANYDSTEDLKKTVETISPADETEVTTFVSDAYRRTYMLMHYGDLNKVMVRSSEVREGIEKDNEKAKKNNESVASVEGSTASITTLTKMKVDNIQALLNYTELLLQRMKIIASYDLANHSFKKVNNVQAVGDFNFDNYRFVMPSDADLAAADVVTPPEKGAETVDKSLLENSESIFKEGYAYAVKPKEKEEKTSGGDSNENK